jgi:hypothetical protein
MHMMPGHHYREYPMKQIFIISLIAFTCIWHQDANAFWGSDSSVGNSGLDVTTGFDINTITTVSGVVTTPPGRKGQEQHTELSIETARGAVTVVLGPWSYWEKQSMIITKSQEVMVTGSLAQGKDGLLYVFAQRIENRNNGESVVLRSESGKPLWSAGGAQGRNGTYQNQGSGSRNGAGNRGSGMRGGRR